METRLNTKSGKNHCGEEADDQTKHKINKTFVSYKQNSQRERENNLHYTDCYLAECLINFI